MTWRVRDRRVVCVGEVTIEHSRDGVAGEILERGVHDELEASAWPRRRGSELPGCFAAGHGDVPGYAVAVAVDHCEAPSEQRVIERAVEADNKRIPRSRGRGRHVPRLRPDPCAHVGADVVPAGAARRELPAFGVDESVVDDQLDRHALP